LAAAQAAKIGIDADLIATGILTPFEVESALHCYTGRRMYLVATAAGGCRFVSTATRPAR
jgi:hypothetical protein